MQIFFRKPKVASDKDPLLCTYQLCELEIETPQPNDIKLTRSGLASLFNYVHVSKENFLSTNFGSKVFQLIINTSTYTTYMGLLLLPLKF